MTLQAHLSELISKHKALETELADAIAHPASTDQEIAEIKRRKEEGKPLSDECTDAMRRLTSNSENTLSSVTATCQGTFASPLPERIAQTLHQHFVPVHKMLFGAMSLTVVVDGKDRDKALQLLHAL